MLQKLVKNSLLSCIILNLVFGIQIFCENELNEIVFGFYLVSMAQDKRIGILNDVSTLNFGYKWNKNVWKLYLIMDPNSFHCDHPTYFKMIFLMIINVFHYLSTYKFHNLIWLKK